MISERLLGVLACPKCKGNIQVIKEKLVCSECKSEYGFKEGIPEFKT